MAPMRELAELIEQNTGTDGVHATAIPCLTLHRATQASKPLYVVCEPAVCIVAQGRKQALAGDGIYIYGTESYLVVSVETPFQAQILDASQDKPLLCLLLTLDPAAIGAMMLECDVERASHAAPGPALAVSAVTRDLRDACIRLVRLLSSPRDIPVLAPLIEREILYLLLRGEQGSRVGQIAFAESKLQQVNRAINWIKRNFREALCAKTLASEVGMSRSGLYQHFRAVTGLSPLQYQKQLRLQEARRLLLGQAVDAAGAGHLVGYESASQFNREYRRLFGAPPRRDVAKLRACNGAVCAWPANRSSLSIQPR